MALRPKEIALMGYGYGRQSLSVFGLLSFEEFEASTNFIKNLRDTIHYRMESNLIGNLSLPQTSFEFKRVTQEPLQLSSRAKTETREVCIYVYGDTPGELLDAVEEQYKAFVGIRDLASYPNGIGSKVTIGKVRFENFNTKFEKPFIAEGKRVYSASIQFDAVITREG